MQQWIAKTSFIVYVTDKLLFATACNVVHCMESSSITRTRGAVITQGVPHPATCGAGQRTTARLKAYSNTDDEINS